MPLIKSILDFIESPGGPRLGDARRDVERAAQRFVDRHANKEEEGFQNWQRMAQGLLDSLENKAAETVLKALLWLMQARIVIDDNLGFKPFRQNLLNFPPLDGSYRSYANFLFRTKPGVDESVSILVEFKDGEMDWEETDSQDAIATLEFKDGKVLLEYLGRYVLFGDRDILTSMLRNEVTVTGNTNYIFKFLFMINSILLEVQKKLP